MYAAVSLENAKLTKFKIRRGRYFYTFKADKANVIQAIENGLGKDVKSCIKKRRVVAKASNHSAFLFKLHFYCIHSAVCGHALKSKIFVSFISIDNSRTRILSYPFSGNRRLFERLLIIESF